MNAASEKRALLAGILATAAAGLCLGIGLTRLHPLYDAGAAEFGMVQVATNITERTLVSDATFSGVARHADGRLYSTYDRTTPKTKQSCPT